MAQRRSARQARPTVTTPSVSAPVSGASAAAEQTDLAVTTRRSARAQVAAAINRFLTDNGEVHIPTLTEHVMTEIKADDEFLDSFLRQSLRPMVYEIASQAVARTRGLILFQDRMITREAFTTIVFEQRKKFPLWLEWTPMGQKRLLDMRRPEVLQAAERREQRAAAEMARAGWLRKIAEALPDDEHTVGETLSDEELVRLSAIAQGVELLNGTNGNGALPGEVAVA